ncbi:unnamed protein product [Hermetia illucens]|uniref:Uncharacterized protein n=1 Tax=Hermetia illucens TaxID=343691 RepID=A0A7R8YPX5_HERIL|nr:unnamed protein product [Hermetia illucens]
MFPSGQYNFSRRKYSKAIYSRRYKASHHQRHKRRRLTPDNSLNTYAKYALTAPTHSEQAREAQENIIVTTLNRYKHKQRKLNQHLKRLKADVCQFEKTDRSDPSWKRQLEEIENQESIIDTLRESIAIDLVQISAQMEYEPLVERDDAHEKGLSDIVQNYSISPADTKHVVIDVNIDDYPLDGFDGKASNYFRMLQETEEQTVDEESFAVKVDEEYSPKNEQVAANPKIIQDSSSKLQPLPTDETGKDSIPTDDKSNIDARSKFAVVIAWEWEDDSIDEDFMWDDLVGIYEPFF